MRRIILGLLLLAAGPLSADTKLVYDFEGGTQGFSGKTAASPTGATNGQSALEIDATGSVGWNQNLAIQSKNEDWSEAVEMTGDVFMPAGTKAAAEYVQFIPVFSGEKDGWYQAGKVELQDGKNSFKLPIAGGTKIGTPWKLHFVLLSGKAIPGKVYVDNIRMRSPGKPGKLTVQVKDEAGAPVPGVIVAAGTAAVTTDAQGKALLDLPGDPYPAEVLGAAIVPKQFTANVPSKSSAEQTVVVKRVVKGAPMQVIAKVEAGKPGIVFDSQRIYGHNMAMWSGIDPFKSQDQIKKLKAIRANMIRIPGGEYGNRWDWKTGAIKKLDKNSTLEWTPEATWPVWKKWFADMGPQAEAFIVINTFLGTPEDQVAWIRDARDSGIKVRYVELGNEPDLFPERWFHGEEGASTDVAKYVKAVVPYAKAIRAAFPDIKILGPITAQIDNKECVGKSPWLCNKYDKNGELLDDPEHDDWIRKFLRLYSKEGDLLDGVSVHSYPYYPRWLGQTEDVWDAKQAFSKVAPLSKYLAKYKAWMKEYYPAKADRMDIALTEYHLQVAETWVTSDVESAVFIANYLAEFIKGGGTLASAWDINTFKVADGGGHGMLDPNNDPTRPYAERAKYWIFKMMANNFTGSLVPAQTNSNQVVAYAAKDRGRTTVMLINRDPNASAKVTVHVSGASGATKLRQIQLNKLGYLWSKVLFRAVLNQDPTANQKVYGAPAEKNGWRSFAPVMEPMSVSLYVLE
jgi:hypothetical protein